MTLLDHTPQFSLEDANKIAYTLYEIYATVNPLPSERDQNFLLQTDRRERFVFKIANATEERIMLEAQNMVMEHLAKHIEFCPKVIPAENRDEITSIQSSAGETHFVRLVTYLHGTPLGNVRHHSDELLFDLGSKIGQLTTALQGFDHPALRP